LKKKEKKEKYEEKVCEAPEKLETIQNEIVKNNSVALPSFF